MKFKLDFNIYSAKDRLEAVRQIDLSSLNKTELETVTNYILYGKDEDGTSIVDRKEVQIKTKFNSYQKDRTVSLEELLESPTFDETIFQKNRTIYKKGKPQIDKERAATIPGMVELWGQIDNLTHILRQNEGKEPFQPQTPKLDSHQIYLLNHHLIQLRTSQYYLWDSAFPTMGTQKNKAEFHDTPSNSHLSYPVFPRGLTRYEHDHLFENPRTDNTQIWEILTDDYLEELKVAKKPYFDFRDSNHLYQLIQHYEEIQDFIKDYPDSLLNNLLWTLDFYIEKANLSEQQLLIVECKKKRMPNKQISQVLDRELGIHHQENYISTIWNKAVGLIKEAVELNFDEFICKDYKKAWKVCNRCGRELLRDSRNFVKKAKATDGLTGRCKQCDKEIRQGAPTILYPQKKK